MANLMDMVKGAVTQQVMGQIGNVLGTDSKKTSGLFDGAAGAILGGLMQKGQSDEGANQIFDMARKQDDGILDKLGDLIGGGQQEEYVRQGGGILDGIIGGGQKTSMIEQLAGFFGLGKGLIGKLLSMVAPIIMGVIGRHVKNKALDAVGLKGLLGSQGPNLAGVLPSGLGNQLGFGNLLGNAAGAVGNAADAVGSAVGSAGRAATSAAGSAANAAADAGGGLAKMLLPLLLLAALVIGAIFLVPKLLNSGAKKITEDQLGKYTTDIKGKYDDLASAIGDISDLDSAKKFGTTLGETTGYLGSLDFSGIDKGKLGAIKDVIGNTKVLEEGMAKAYEKKDIKDYLKPLFDKFLAAVKKLVGAM